MQVAYHSHTDSRFNPPDVLDTSIIDQREAEENAVVEILGDKSRIYDVIVDETLQLDNLAEIIAALNVCSDRNVHYWVEKMRSEFELKMAKQIELQTAIELEKIEASNDN